MKKNLLSVASLLLIFACNNASNTVENKDTTTQATATATTTLPATKTTEYTLKTGKVVTVTESHPKSADLSDISIQLKDDPNSMQSFQDTDPISEVLVGDVTGDGFDEVYVITKSTKSDAKGNLYAVVSNKDLSITPIYLAPIEPKDLEKGGNFEGYEGQDKFQIIENSINRTFPIKGQGVTTRAINYKIKAGEAGFVFWIKTSTAY